MLQSTLNQRPRVEMDVLIYFMYLKVMMYCYLWFSINIEKKHEFSVYSFYLIKEVNNSVGCF